jgi:hypothetical protein
MPNSLSSSTSSLISLGSNAGEIDNESEYDAGFEASSPIVRAANSDPLAMDIAATSGETKPPVLKATSRYRDLKFRDVFGKRMVTVMCGDKEYFIGVQIAHFLKRETFNLYRSMKLNNIDIIKCGNEEIEELTQIDAIKRGIHSVTLVPYEAGLSYIARELKRKPRKKSEKRRSLPAAESPRGSPYLRPRRARSFSSIYEVEEEDDYEPETYESGSQSPEEKCCGTGAGTEDQHADVASKMVHWEKLLLVASMERMKMDDGAAEGVAPAP